jgi:hypothetical protein
VQIAQVLIGSTGFVQSKSPLHSARPVEEPVSNLLPDCKSLKVFF